MKSYAARFWAYLSRALPHRPALDNVKQTATPLPWKPSTHHQIPQPAGAQCVAWYEAEQPSACEILYALAHTKGERDKLVAALRTIFDAEFGRGNDAEKIAPGTYWAKAKALLREIKESS